jgi:dipeptidyl aminopeptidase/acylaminoacyl peptidase
MKASFVALLIASVGSQLPAIPSAEKTEAIARNLLKPPNVFNARVGPSGQFLTYMGFGEETGKKRIHSLDLGTLDDDEWSMRYRFDWRPQYEISGYYWVDPENVFYWGSSSDVFGGGSFFSPGSLSGGMEVIVDDMGSVNILDSLIGKKRYSLFNRYRAAHMKKADPYPDVVQVDMRTGSFIEKLLNPGNIETWMTDNAGVVRLGFFDAGSGVGVLHREDEADDWSEIHAPDPYIFGRPEDDPGDEGLTMQIMGFFPGDEKLIVLVENEDGLFGLQLLELDGMKLLGKPIFREPYSLDEGYVFHEFKQGLPIGFAYWGEKKERIYFDKGYRQLAAAVDKALPGMENTILGFSADGRFCIIESESDRQPGVISRLEMKEQGGLGPILIKQPWIDREALSEVKPITFQSRDDATIYGYIALPAGKSKEDGPFPLLTIVHGGPTARDKWGYNPEVQFFTALGFAVLQVNYRGSTGYGSKYQGGTWLYAAEKGVHDVADGVRWAIDKGIVREGRIFIYGASFGGYTTAMSLIEEPDLYRAGVAAMGVYDWETIHDEDTSRGYAWVDEIFADMEEKRDEYRRWSPRHHVEKITKPILVLHGELDSRVNVKQSRHLTDAMDEKGIPYEYKETYWMHHGFMDYGRPEMIQYYLDIAGFFRKHF